MIRATTKHLRKIRRHGAAFVLLAVLLFAFGNPGSGVAQTQPAERLNRVQEIQQLLKAEGFDPGPPDGLMGTRTVQAIIAFQRREGLPRTGRAGPSVLRRLQERLAARSAPRASAPAAPSVHTAPDIPAPAPADPAPSIGLSGARWQLIDETGSRQIIRLLASGRVSETAKPDFWKWRIDGETLKIDYDTGAGGWVRRTGRLTSENRIEGTATSSRGRTWRWTGRRLEN